jgi:hypothetical protein
VVLRAGQHHQGAAVGDRQQSGFLALQQFLNEDSAARFPKFAVNHGPLDGVFGFGGGMSQDNAFARRQAVRLDHQRPAVFARVGEGFLRVREDVEVRRGDAVFAQERLGEDL